MDQLRRTGRALVVGSAGPGGQSVDFDVQSMAALLADRGFAIDVRTGERATRAGILAGYEQLIAEARLGEPAVFYYTGHGHRGTAEIAGGRYWQAICPTDIAASTDSDFRGITAWELSILQRRLTARTRNVTVILDCCYASQMSRALGDTATVPRAAPYPSRLGFDVHLRWLRARYGDAFDAVDPVGDRDAVRLVACAEDECAVMYSVAGQYRGAFTEALVTVLADLGDAVVSWAELLYVIRARVRRVSLIQQPQVEGPARRRPFSLEEVDGSDTVPISAMPGGFRIAAGWLHGVQVGDVYGVVAPEARVHRAVDAIAEVTVRDVSETSAHAELRAWHADSAELPDAALAIPIARSAMRYRVRLVMPHPAQALVAEALERAGALRAAGSDDAPTFATLRLLGDAVLTIEDAHEVACHQVRFPDGLPDAIRHLSQRASAERLRELAGEHGVSSDELDITWGAVVHGAPRRLPDHGAELGLRDRVWLRVRSTARRAHYVHLFRIGSCGTIQWLTPDFPTGFALDAQEPEYIHGRRADGAFVGVAPSRPSATPRGPGPRMEELIVIITAGRICLRALETVARDATARGACEDGPLAGPAARMFFAGDRRPSDGFFVKRLSYSLHPRDERVAESLCEVEPP